MSPATQRFRYVARRRARVSRAQSAAAAPLLDATLVAAPDVPPGVAGDVAIRHIGPPATELPPAPASATVTVISGASTAQLRFGLTAVPNGAGVVEIPRFIERRTKPRNGRGVRALNVAVASLLLVLLAPLMLLIALAVRLSSPGPVIYRQVRVGRDRRRYGMRTPVDRRQRADRRWAFGAEDRRRAAVPVEHDRRSEQRRLQSDRRLYSLVVREERRTGSERRNEPRDGAEDRRRRIVVAVHDRRVWNTCGQSFTMFKFRSMRVDAEQGTGAVWARKSDPRVTPIGALLRKTRLDELPQLINVLRGDMNIVGPRPERPTIIPTLWQNIAEYPIRQRLRPGITGLAQINHAYDSSIDDVRAKVGYDIEYLRKRSVLQDLRIMIRTPIVMFFKRSGQ